MELSQKGEKLLKIKKEVIDLKESPLYSYRIKNENFPVIGEGDHNANLMFIGEAPGKNEAKTGRPFCGKAGKILDDLLEGVDIDRESTYITNIIKDRPPENRDPTSNEIILYSPFLDRQIKIIKPDIIAPLGRFSAHYILKKFSFGEDFAISKIHGKIYQKEEIDFKIIPLFHPAASIYRPNRKEELVEDFKIIKKELRK